MKLFIDADSILFKAACVNKRKGSEDHYEDDLYAVRRRVDDVIKGAIQDCWADETYIAIKGKGNFRYGIYPDYKGNRKDKPMGENLRERLNHAYYHVAEKWNAVPADGMEADDLVAIWAHEAREAEEQWILAHIDKDINQIAGNHYNYDKKEIYFVDDDTADMSFCIQLLIGDGGDNIPKLRKGLGIKTAEKYLANTNYDDRMAVIVDLYRRHYGRGWEQRLNVIGNLLWMKRTFSEELEWNYEDRYTRQTDVSEQDGGDQSDSHEDGQVVHSEVSDAGLQGLSDTESGSDGRDGVEVRSDSSSEDNN